MLLWILIALGATSALGASGGINQACAIINSLPCDQVSQTPVCGSDGVLYPSECDFAKAQCKDSGLQAGQVCTLTTTEPSTNSTSNTTAYPISNSTMLPVTPLTTVQTLTTIDSNATTIDSSMMGNGSTASSPAITDDTITNSTNDINVTMTTTPTDNMNVTMTTTSTDNINVTMTTPTAANNVSMTTTTTDNNDNVTMTTIQTTHTTTISLPDGISAVCRIVLVNPCPPGDNPVCATGNVEYPSLCHFTQAQCYNPDLTILHGGACPLVTTTKAPTAENIICHAILSQPCNDDGVLLCGSDGVTYGNSCEYEKERCIHEDMYVVKPGRC